MILAKICAKTWFNVIVFHVKARVPRRKNTNKIHATTGRTYEVHTGRPESVSQFCLANHPCATFDTFNRNIHWHATILFSIVLISNGENGRLTLDETIFHTYGQFTVFNDPNVHVFEKVRRIPNWDFMNVWQTLLNTTTLNAAHCSSGSDLNKEVRTYYCFSPQEFILAPNLEYILKLFYRSINHETGLGLGRDLRNAAWI